MKTMWVKILEEEIKHHCDRFYKDEIRKVSYETGIYFCSMGWAEDTEGNVETAERDTGRSLKLDVHNGKIATNSVEVK